MHHLKDILSTKIKQVFERLNNYHYWPHTLVLVALALHIDDEMHSGPD